MRVLILAAGYGTRLYPVTIDLPKALISIKGKPLIDFIMDKVIILSEQIDIEEIIIVSNHKFYGKFMKWKDNARTKVTVINDGTKSPDERLGAIGDIRFVLDRREDDDWLILGSDNFFNWNLNDFVNFALRKKPYPCVGVYDIGDKESLSNFGVVDLEVDMRVRNFIEKPRYSSNGMVATCIYFFSRESLSLFTSFLKEGEDNDASGKYIEWLVRKHVVYGYTFNGKWLDIGHRDALKELGVFIDYVSGETS